MSGQNAYQQQFQNAGQNGNFSYSYNNVGNNAWVFPALLVGLLMLVAILRSEARYRALLEQIAFGETGRVALAGRRTLAMRAPRKMARRR